MKINIKFTCGYWWQRILRIYMKKNPIYIFLQQKNCTSPKNKYILWFLLTTMAFLSTKIQFYKRWNLTMLYEFFGNKNVEDLKKINKILFSLKKFFKWLSFSFAEFNSAYFILGIQEFRINFSLPFSSRKHLSSKVSPTSIAVLLSQSFTTEFFYPKAHYIDDSDCR